jgi:hypothetical protein
MSVNETEVKSPKEGISIGGQFPKRLVSLCTYNLISRFCIYTVFNVGIIF